MHKGLVYIFSVSLLLSCGGDEDEANTDTDGSGSIIGNTNPDNSSSQPTTTFLAEESKIEGMETTSIEYFDLKHDFGNVFYPSDNKFTFKFKNTGTLPLVIDKATASCGCTIPNKPEEPILPGAIGELDVIFRPKSGQVGQVVTKKITVVANTNPKESYLEITANVMDAM
jgi:Protein of unknown function (DUF1573)